VGSGASAKEPCRVTLSKGQSSMARARHKALQWSVAPVVVKSLTQRTSRLLLVVAAVLALSVNVLGGLANAADPIYRAEYVRTPSPTVTSFTSELLTLTFPIRNTGDAVWAAAGTNPVRLSYHWYDLAGRVVVWDGLRTSIVTDHAAGQERQYEMKVMTPGAPGECAL
jgi:hypothetical protein